MNGIILIDKPKGFTSFDVVAKMRKLCKTKKVGHGGTLDPLATGVLPILVGNATKFQQFLQDSDKEYLAEFKFGITTDTQDITGKVLSTNDVNIGLKDIEKILPKFTGSICQIPPMYSAIKKDGKKLYEFARNGIIIDRKPREIRINFINLLDFDENSKTAKILVSCSKGTYIRTLCSDIGSQLGCGATLTELRRTKACSFSVSECSTVEEIINLSQSNSICTKLISIDNALKNYKQISITESQSVRFKNGGFLSLEYLNIYNPLDQELFRVFYNKQFLGLGIINLTNNQLKVLKLAGV